MWSLFASFCIICSYQDAKHWQFDMHACRCACGQLVIHIHTRTNTYVHGPTLTYTYPHLRTCTHPYVHVRRALEFPACTPHNVASNNDNNNRVQFTRTVSAENWLLTSDTFKEILESCFIRGKFLAYLYEIQLCQYVALSLQSVASDGEIEIGKMGGFYIN